MGFIYKITNKTTGDFYIGKTKNHYETRWKAHIAVFNMSDDVYEKKRKWGCGFCHKLRTAMKEHGIDSFLFEVIDTVPDDILIKTEKSLITTLDPKYNMRKK